MGQYLRIDTKSVIFERFGAEVIAIHLDRGIYYSLNAAAADILELIAAQASRGAIVAALERKYSAADGVIGAAVDRFLDELKTEKLIQEAVSGGSPAAALAAEGAGKQAFEAPALAAHRDMQELFLLDPVHDVSAQGWPEQRPQDAR